MDSDLESRVELHVIFGQGDVRIDLEHVYFHRLAASAGSLAAAIETAEVLDEISPDAVEFADAFGLGAVFLSKRGRSSARGGPVSTVVHHTGFREIWEWGSKRKFEESPLFFRRVVALEDLQSALVEAHAAPSKFLAGFLSEKMGREVGIRRYPAQTGFAAKPEPTTHSDRVRLVSFGRFEARKCQLDLIVSAVELLEQGLDFEIMFIGGSTPDWDTGVDYRTLCFDRIPDQFLGNFRFFDYMSISRLADFASTAKWMVIPSKFENFPNTAIEALQVGVPVIGSEESGVADFAEDFPSVLFTNGSVKNSLTETLRWAINADGGVRRAALESQVARLHEMLAPSQTVEGPIRGYQQRSKAARDELDVSEKLLPSELIFIMPDPPIQSRKAIREGEPRISIVDSESPLPLMCAEGTFLVLSPSALWGKQIRHIQELIARDFRFFQTHKAVSLVHPSGEYVPYRDYAAFAATPNVCVLDSSVILGPNVLAYSQLVEEIAEAFPSPPIFLADTVPVGNWGLD